MPWILRYRPKEKEMNLNCAVDRIQMRDQKDSENAETAKQEHRRLLERPGECFVNWTVLRSYKDPSTGTPAVSPGIQQERRAALSLPPPKHAWSYHFLLVTAEKGLTAGESQR